MVIQVNNLAEELQINLDKVARDGSDKADTSSSGSGEEKEDYDDKKPMIAKEVVVKEKSLLGSLIGWNKNFKISIFRTLEFNFRRRHSQLEACQHQGD